MKQILNKPQGTRGARNFIEFSLIDGKLGIDTFERNYLISDSEIETRDGIHFFKPSKQNPKCTLKVIEIPEDVIERKDALNIDLQNRKGSIASIDHKAGKIYFSLNEDGQIITKLGDKEAIANDIEIIETKKGIDVTSLGLEFPYLEIPADVEKAFSKAKDSKIMENCHLIYAGKSLLTGKTYFKLNSEIPSSKWDCIEDLFENFGSGSGRTGELKGWLTNQPENVRKLLGLKTTEGKREHDDEVKQFEDAITALENVK